MTNPFDRDDQPYLVLTNHEGQHSLWPASNEVPAGWTIVFGPGTRVSCLDYVSAHWTDMRPRSVISGEAPRA